MQPTKKLFYENGACRSFAATVLCCEAKGDAFRAALNATAFYPEGGGQPADFGTLGDARVIDVHEENGVIWHTLTQPLQAGQCVQGEVDWLRRVALRQQHTGEHIVSGLVHARFGYDNVGFHIGEDTVRMDFSGPLTARELAEIERAANEVVWQNAPVMAEVPSPEALAQLAYRSKKELTGEVRIVTVKGADVCACCGLHVESAGEVGCIRLLDSQSYKGGTRVAMVCGVRALENYRAHCGEVNTISALLSAKPLETAAAVRRLYDEADALRAALCQAQNLLFAAEAKQYAGKQNAVCFMQGLSPDALRRLCLALCEQCSGVCAAFSQTQGGFAYALGSTAQDVRELGKAMNKALQGRGGGKPGLVQGSVQCTAAQVEAFFAGLKE